MIAPKLRNRVMQDLAKGYAMDLAAKELRLDHECQTYDNSNPLIQKRADEIMKDPELRDVVIKVSEGKTVEEIRKLHNPAELGGNISLDSVYQRAKVQVRYEKRCADAAAEAALRKNDPDHEPAPEEIRKCADALLKDARFNAFMRKKESGLEGYEDYQNAMRDLNDLGKRNQFLLELAPYVAKPAPQQINNEPEQQRIQIRQPEQEQQIGLN